MAGANQTAIGSLVPIWAGDSGSSVDPVTPPVVDYYVSPALGNDNNAGTIASPLATLNRVEELLPDIITNTNYRVHLRNEVYPLPSGSRNTWLRSRILQNGKITIFADEAWDPTVYSILVAAAAAVGTNANVIVTAGLVPNAHRGQSIRMTSGAANGQIRRINENTATDIVLDVPFGALPVAGNTFQIFTPQTVISVPAPVAPMGRYLFHDVMVATGPRISIGLIGQLSQLNNDEGIHVQGVIVASANNQWFLGAGPTYLWGVDSNANCQKIGGQVMSGAGPSEILRLGWGYSCLNPLQLRDGAIFGGTYHSELSFITIDIGCIAHVGGGFSPTALGNIFGFLQINATTSTPFLFDPGDGSIAVRLTVPSAQIVLAQTLSRGGLLIENGARALITGTLTGQGIGSSVIVQGASQLLCNSAPVFGDAVANDWVVQGAAAFNKAALAVLYATVLGTEGSLATRSI